MTRAEMKAISHSTPVQIGLVVSVVVATFAAGVAWAKVETNSERIRGNMADIKQHTTDIQTIKEAIVTLTEVSRQNATLIAELRSERRYSPGG